jgi:hypothetical protein
MSSIHRISIEAHSPSETETETWLDGVVSHDEIPAAACLWSKDRCPCISALLFFHVNQDIETRVADSSRRFAQTPTDHLDEVPELSHNATIAARD